MNYEVWILQFSRRVDKAISAWENVIEEPG